ncbi:MAG TPA: hypothetical protein VJR30_26225 [Bradyrhizobium sp.]|nr:hypothetical protein [Bradyrhizobium sp.]
MIAYWAVPYLVVAAPPAIVLLTIMIGGCTMTRTASDPVEQARLYSDPDSRAGDALVRELDRRAARDDLRRLIAETTR